MPKGVPAPGPWDLPGDNVNLDNEGLGEGMHPYIRMGIIVRARRLDLRILMDAHDLHNRGFVDKNTFQRSLAYAFGNQWNELQLTTDLLCSEKNMALSRVGDRCGALGDDAVLAAFLGS